MDREHIDTEKTRLTGIRYIVEYMKHKDSHWFEKTSDFLKEINSSSVPE